MVCIGSIAGQHIYTDFSTPLGIALYSVPLLFVHSASDLVLSINYASGLYLLIGLVVVAYLTWTRLSPVLGLALGIWIALALAARMNAGDGPMAVTLAENYNRNCSAALALALLVFRTPRASGLMIAIADGLLYALLTAFCLYTKITYGLVALAFAPIVIYPHPRRLVTFSSFAIAFGLLVVAVEYGYGTRFQWLQAVQTAAGAGECLESRAHRRSGVRECGGVAGLRPCPCLVSVAGATDHAADSDFLRHGRWCIRPFGAV